MRFINSTNVPLTFAIANPTECFNSTENNVTLPPDSDRDVMVRFDFDCYLSSANETASINYTVSYSGTPIFTLKHMIPSNAGVNGEQDSTANDVSVSSCGFKAESPISFAIYDETFNKYVITGDCTSAG